MTTTTITTAAVLDTITELSGRVTGSVFDRLASLDQLVTAFGIDVEDDSDSNGFDQLLAALRELKATGAIVEGAVAGARTVYAPQGSTVPQEW